MHSQQWCLGGICEIEGWFSERKGWWMSPQYSNQVSTNHPHVCTVRSHLVLRETRGNLSQSPDDLAGPTGLLWKALHSELWGQVGSCEAERERAHSTALITRWLRPGNSLWPARFGDSYEIFLAVTPCSMLCHGCVGNQFILSKSLLSWFLSLVWTGLGMIIFYLISPLLHAAGDINGVVNNV